MTLDIITNRKKSFERITVISETLAPKTFRIPISFVRCSAANDARAKRPRHAMTIERIENDVKIVPIRCS